MYKDTTEQKSLLESWSSFAKKELERNLIDPRISPKKFQITRLGLKLDNRSTLEMLVEG